MPLKKRRTIDKGQLIGAIIFITLFIGLIYLGLTSTTDSQFDNSFFEDIGKVMKGE